MKKLGVSINNINNKIKICYLITGLNIGGAEMMLYRLVERLDKTKYDIVVVSIVPLGKVAEKISRLGIKVISLEMKSKLDVLVVIRFIRLLKKNKPMILHCFLFHANLLGRIVGKLVRVPVIISSIRSINIGGGIREKALKYTDVFSDATTTVSHVAAEHIIRNGIVSEDKLRVIYNGIDVSLIGNKRNDNNRRETNGPFLLITVGRLHESKGYPFLIQSASILKEKGYKFKWLIAGDGELKPTLEQLVTDYNIEDSITLLGLRDDVPQLLCSSDIFVLSSLWEGLPGVIIEAMAAGLPVVATNVGGTPELVEDGINGFLVPPANPTMMADAIEKLFKMSEEGRRKMGEMGREIVKEKFTVDKMVSNHEQLYMDLLRQKGFDVQF